MKDKYRLKEMPSSWLKVKEKKINLSDIVKLKRAFNTADDTKVAEPAAQMDLAEVKDEEIVDPVVRENEAALNNLGRDVIITHKKIHRDYAKIEFPMKSLKKTKTAPHIKWCVNKKYCLTDFYKT